MNFKQTIKSINRLRIINNSFGILVSKSTFSTKLSTTESTFSTKLSINSSYLKTDIKNDTYFIKLNRPNKRNCLNFETIELLSELLKQIDQNEKVKRIVFYGEGENFCSGFDLNEIKQINESRLIDLCASNGDWFKSNKLLIAFVQGYAVGLGFELAIACDILIADQSAKFGFLNRRFGVPTFLPLVRLKNKIGRLAAIELLDDAHLINSKEAVDLGLIKYLSDESSTSLNELDNVLKLIQLDNKQLETERSNLNSQIQFNKSINDLPSEWKNYNFNTSNQTERHGKFDLSYWNDIQKIS